MRVRLRKEAEEDTSVKQSYWPREFHSLKTTKPRSNKPANHQHEGNPGHTQGRLLLKGIWARSPQLGATRRGGRRLCWGLRAAGPPSVVFKTQVLRVLYLPEECVTLKCVYINFISNISFSVKRRLSPGSWISSGCPCVSGFFPQTVMRARRAISLEKNAFSFSFQGSYGKMSSSLNYSVFANGFLNFTFAQSCDATSFSILVLEINK